MHAAAPDLLAACQDALESVDRGWVRGYKDRLRAAIAKAKGGVA